MIEHFIGLLAQPRQVLDAGCGAGRMLPYLADRGCVQGFDLSEQMVARARMDHPGFPVTVGSMTAIKHPDGTFDGVFSWYSTIHNPDEDLHRMILEMVRVLAPGGHLLVAFQTGQGMRRVGKRFQAMGYDIVMNRYHRSAEWMRTRLEDQGLTVVACLDRGPAGGEADGQAVLIARRPACPGRRQ